LSKRWRERRRISDRVRSGGFVRVGHLAPDQNGSFARSAGDSAGPIPDSDRGKGWRPGSWTAPSMRRFAMNEIFRMNFAKRPVSGQLRHSGHNRTYCDKIVKWFHTDFAIFGPGIGRRLTHSFAQVAYRVVPQWDKRLIQSVRGARPDSDFNATKRSLMRTTCPRGQTISTASLSSL
jgi:hypothetical protein